MPKRRALLLLGLILALYPVSYLVVCSVWHAEKRAGFRDYPMDGSTVTVHGRKR